MAAFTRKLRSEPGITRRAACVALFVAAACGATTRAGSSGRPEPAVFLFDVAAHPDSALKLAKFALGAVDGTVQLPQVRPEMTSVSTHYTRSRRGGGQTQVAIMVAIARRVADTLAPVTQLEVSAWALDMAQQPPSGQRRGGFSGTALSNNAPALRRPRAITPQDTVDFRALEHVVEAFEAKGARRRP